MTHRISAFLAALAFLAMGTIAPAFAQMTPPLNGEMARMKLLDEPSTMPNLLLSLPDGKTKSLNDYKGRIVLLNMWATWCPPCVKELPSLNALQHAVDPNYIQVLAVSIDGNSDLATPTFLIDNNLDKLEPFIDKQEALVTLEQLRGAQGIPITLLIDPQSRLLGYYQGDADWNGADARAMLDYYRENLSFVPFSFGSFPG